MLKNQWTPSSTKQNKIITKPKKQTNTKQKNPSDYKKQNPSLLSIDSYAKNTTNKLIKEIDLSLEELFKTIYAIIKK